MFSVITNKTLIKKIYINIYIIKFILKKLGKFEIDNLKIKLNIIILITKSYKTWCLCFINYQNNIQRQMKNKYNNE